ncbi:single-stranded DNA-binding protein [Candidatus Collierbacteria bacterium CG10_big_fil_rev_8_21_14_0_10_43_36]|uniref:Single-stranded DNA-binding protein n=3 Tax=Candidatus Collieribacteriota TaxID=1752725 RepID=A0A2H0DT03_9BACT|nr:single-stranded DNA-binding protein [bacterium]PIP85254.1 MAG: single-stranded DNA-binding protein [Candidatus Collierbacteria bacterium CG22_combo_CG10-13_8_21_14_all_43_12]PIR99557.1 MAG: single-stranded DNA-binding protein [Candidatus Collierbacteria bacterium CG10_big_fil_rev_8_21_14_0_10_43_36]PIZ24377.1 MAG: single-stranded DNA-binding protein [Candidatus Collierbacteria bacterium CG_4_10_14_0_8_um_filter_43_86]PJB48837.1 MAG: single-stranded DNA-binding protein [Candidatus Collierbact
MSTRSLNRVTLIGNLTRDPELKYTPQGTSVCTFGLATNREWTDSSGQKQEGAEFHRIVAWGKLGEICSQLLVKGQKAFVEGRLQTRQWKTQDGSDRQITEVVIEEMIALNTPRSSSEGYKPNYTAVEPKAESFGDTQDKQVSQAEEVFSADAKGSSKDVNDEIPF